MKIKKLGKILAILCTFALLCGCANNSTDDQNKSSTEQSTENSTFSDPANSSDVSSYNSDEILSNTSSKPEPQPVDIGNGMTLTGTLLDESELEEFSLEPYVSNYILEKEAEGFFDDIEIPEIKNLYKRTQSLIALLSTTEFNPTFASVGNGRNPAIIRTADGIRYVEWGYTYKSFDNAYLSVFTKETLEKIFKEYDFFLNYNDALFCEIVSKGGWLGEVHREFELISKSDTVIEFKRLTFHHDSDDKPAAEWIPELRNEYGIGVTEFKFVLTEDGWRAANIPVEYEAEI